MSPSVGKWAPFSAPEKQPGVSVTASLHLWPGVSGRRAGLRARRLQPRDSPQGSEIPTQAGQRVWQGQRRGVGGRTGTNAGMSLCSEPAPHLSLHPPCPHRGSPGPSARLPGDEGDSPVSRASPRGRVPLVTLPQPPFSLTSSRQPPWSPPLDPRARPSFAAVSGDERQSQGAGSGAGRGAAVGGLAGRACGWSDGGEGPRAWSPGGGPRLRKEDGSRLGCPLHSVAAHAAARGAGLKPRVKWTRGRVGPSGGEVRSGP